MTLPEPDDVKKTRKVDWKKVLSEVINRPVSVSEIIQIAKKHALTSNINIYYSEVKRVLNTWSKKYNIERKINPRTGVYMYLVTEGRK